MSIQLNTSNLPPITLPEMGGVTTPDLNNVDFSSMAKDLQSLIVNSLPASLANQISALTITPPLSYQNFAVFLNQAQSILTSTGTSSSPITNSTNIIAGALTILNYTEQLQNGYNSMTSSAQITYGPIIGNEMNQFLRLFPSLSQSNFFPNLQTLVNTTNSDLGVNCPLQLTLINQEVAAAANSSSLFTLASAGESATENSTTETVENSTAPVAGAISDYSTIAQSLVNFCNSCLIPAPSISTPLNAANFTTFLNQLLSEGISTSEETKGTNYGAAALTYVAQIAQQMESSYSSLTPAQQETEASTLLQQFSLLTSSLPAIPTTATGLQSFITSLDATVAKMNAIHNTTSSTVQVNTNNSSSGQVTTVEEITLLQVNTVEENMQNAVQNLLSSVTPSSLSTLGTLQSNVTRTEGQLQADQKNNASSAQLMADQVAISQAISAFNTAAASLQSTQQQLLNFVMDLVPSTPANSLDVQLLLTNINALFANQQSVITANANLAPFTLTNDLNIPMGSTTATNYQQCLSAANTASQALNATLSNVQEALTSVLAPGMISPPLTLSANTASLLTYLNNLGSAASTQAFAMVPANISGLNNLLNGLCSLRVQLLFGENPPTKATINSTFASLAPGVIAPAIPQINFSAQFQKLQAETFAYLAAAVVEQSTVNNLEGFASATVPLAGLTPAMVGRTMFSPMVPSEAIAQFMTPQATPPNPILASNINNDLQVVTAAASTVSQNPSAANIQALQKAFSLLLQSVAEMPPSGANTVAIDQLNVDLGSLSATIAAMAANPTQAASLSPLLTSNLGQVSSDVSGLTTNSSTNSSLSNLNPYASYLYNQINFYANTLIGNNLSSPSTTTLNNFPNTSVGYSAVLTELSNLQQQILANPPTDSTSMNNMENQIATQIANANALLPSSAALPTPQNLQNLVTQGTLSAAPASPTSLANAFINTKGLNINFAQYLATTSAAVNTNSAVASLQNIITTDMSNLNKAITTTGANSPLVKTACATLQNDLNTLASQIAALPVGQGNYASLAQIDLQLVTASAMISQINTAGSSVSLSSLVTSLSSQWTALQTGINSLSTTSSLPVGTSPSTTFLINELNAYTGDILNQANSTSNLTNYQLNTPALSSALTTLSSLENQILSSPPTTVSALANIQSSLVTTISAINMTLPSPLPSPGNMEQSFTLPTLSLSSLMSTAQKVPYSAPPASISQATLTQISNEMTTLMQSYTTLSQESTPTAQSINQVSLNLQNLLSLMTSSSISETTTNTASLAQFFINALDASSTISSLLNQTFSNNPPSASAFQTLSSTLSTQIQGMLASVNSLQQTPPSTMTSYGSALLNQVNATVTYLMSSLTTKNFSTSTSVAISSAISSLQALAQGIITNPPQTAATYLSEQTALTNIISGYNSQITGTAAPQLPQLSTLQKSIAINYGNLVSTLTKSYFKAIPT